MNSKKGIMVTGVTLGTIALSAFTGRLIGEVGSKLIKKILAEPTAKKTE